MRAALMVLVLASCTPAATDAPLSTAHRDAIALAQAAAAHELEGPVRLTRLTADPAEMTVVFVARTPHLPTDAHSLPRCVVVYRLREARAPELMPMLGSDHCPRAPALPLPACDPLRMARRPPAKMLGVATVEWLGARGWLALDGSDRRYPDDCH
jgi:hypothetical protein